MADESSYSVPPDSFARTGLHLYTTYRVRLDEDRMRARREVVDLEPERVDVERPPRERPATAETAPARNAPATPTRSATSSPLRATVRGEETSSAGEPFAYQEPAPGGEIPFLTEPLERGSLIDLLA